MHNRRCTGQQFRFSFTVDNLAENLTSQYPGRMQNSIPTANGINKPSLRSPGAVAAEGGFTGFHLARDSSCEQISQLLKRKSKASIGMDAPIRRKDVARHHRTRTQAACNPSKTRSGIAIETCRCLQLAGASGMVTLQDLERMGNNADRELCGWCIRRIKDIKICL